MVEQLNDSCSPQIIYRHGAAGSTPVVRGANLRVQTLVVAVNIWGMTPAEIASDYGLRVEQVLAALQFCAEHREEIDAAIEDEAALERAYNIGLDQK